MRLNRKIKNSKSWNYFQEKNVKGKLNVAQKAEMQAEKSTNQQKVLSDLLCPLSAWWGAESSAESVGLTDSQGVGEELCSGKSVEGKWVLCTSMGCWKPGFCPQENSSSGEKGRNERGTHQSMSPRLKPLWNNLQYKLKKLTGSGHSPRSTKGGTAELWPA